ncbi:3'-5' exonuclease [Rhizina undulata]
MAQITGLSSNWKALKKTLSSATSADNADKESNSRTNSLKRKSSTVDEELGLQKKRKPDGTTSKPPASKMTSTSRPPSPSSLPKAPTSASLALWAEDNDIAPEDLAKAYGVPLTSTEIPDTFLGNSDEEARQKTEVGKYIAIDCEMVGVGGEANRSALARVSVVNYHGYPVMDAFVKPKEKVTDYRTWVSGITAASLKDARSFEEVQKEVADLMQGRILIGHAIKHDMDALLLSHPKRDLRDTSRHPTFKKLSMGRTPGLKKLAKEILGIEIQGGQHSSIEDARACMLLYRRYKAEFEQLTAAQFPGHAAAKTGGKGKGKGKKKKKN